MRCHFDSGLAALTVLATLLLFLFPLASGPFTVVHGPATALRAVRFWFQLLFFLFAALPFVAALMGSWIGLIGSGRSADSPGLQAFTVLRC